MSDDLSSASHRIDVLETRVAHQEQIIADLNEMIAAQWSKIDAIARQIDRLHNELQNVGADRGARSRRRRIIDLSCPRKRG